MSFFRRLLIFICLFFAFLVPSFAHEEHTQPSDLASSFAFDQQGHLWRAYVQDGFLQVSSAQDLKHFSGATKVNAEAQDIKPLGEVRPKIAIGTKGEIYVAWMQNLKPRFAGYIWFARSTDGGKSFEKSYIVHQDRSEIGHAFEALQVSPNGEITIVWLDSRDLVFAKKAGKSHAGSSIYYAVSTDQGKTFQSEKKLADGTCECCRIATAVNPQNKVVALWRHVFEGSERDHLMAEIPKKVGDEVVLKRASYGHWKVDGCPHHGAAIASAGDGAHWWGYHLAYFDGNEESPGLYSKRVDGEAWAFTPPKKFGNFKNHAGHPALLSMGDQVWLVWREIDGKNSKILGKFSDNAARDWSAEKVLFTTEEKTDYPHLLSDGKTPYLIWNTQKNGLKILNLSDEKF